jgi:hypothetical protein
MCRRVDTLREGGKAWPRNAAKRVARGEQGGRHGSALARSTPVSWMPPVAYFSSAGSPGPAWTKLQASHAPTIPQYARVPDKKALFAAVVTCNVNANVARLDGHAPAGDTVEDRLVSIATRRLHWALEGEKIDLMRLGIAEARRFPDLASNVKQMARQRGEETVAGLLREATQFEKAETLSAFAPERLATTTRFFIDLVFLPLIVRALFGEKLELLRALDQRSCCKQRCILSCRLPLRRC